MGDEAGYTHDEAGAHFTACHSNVCSRQSAAVRVSLAMEIGQVKQWTIDEDPSMFMSPVAWWKPTTAELWWCLRRLERRFQRLGNGVQGTDFYRYVYNTVYGHLILQSQGHIHLRHKNTPTNQIAPICTTRALYVFLRHVSVFGRQGELVSTVRSTISRAATQVLSVIRVWTHTIAEPCYSLPSGHVTRWHDSGFQ